MADENDLLRQDDIEALLSQAAGKSAPAPKAAPVPDPPSPPPQSPDISQSDIETLFSQAQQALASIDDRQSKEKAMPGGAAPFQWEELSASSANAESATLDLIRDVELDVRIELGRTQMYLEDVLKLRRGSVVPLDKLAGDPVDIFVNGRLVARGEVLVLNDNFCVRVAELFAGVSAA
jgi:flagellar motor switch protein FliN